MIMASYANNSKKRVVQCRLQANDSNDMKPLMQSAYRRFYRATQSARYLL